MKKCSMIFLLCVVGVGLSHAKPMEVIIMPTEPGTPSPYRERGVEENLELLRALRSGELADGAKVLRAHRPPRASSRCLQQR